ncbi:hypothetical protein X962_6324 [Burkholderia pseudomallei MSHR7343]|nr:hypothetical protein X962_6324 [Burkholderia pseudomallei MSHR7343]
MNLFFAPGERKPQSDSAGWRIGYPLTVPPVSRLASRCPVWRPIVPNTVAARPRKRYRANPPVRIEGLQRLGVGRVARVRVERRERLCEAMTRLHGGV